MAKMNKTKKLLDMLYASGPVGLFATELMAGAKYATLVQLCEGIRLARREALKAGYRVERRPLPRAPGQTGRTRGLYVLTKYKRI